ncbi:MAG: ABC transporter permease [Elusimicrobia bacterium]|nr:ABC transporter permease [Elusimicrobiota bacterium]
MKIFSSSGSPLTPHPSPLPYIWLAWKIIFYKGNPTIQKFSVLTAIAAIGVGMASLLVTIGIMDGFHREIKNRILGVSPHVFARLHADNEAQALRQADRAAKNLAGPLGAGFSPFAIGQAMIRTRSGSMGVVVKAIDPKREPSVTNLAGLVKRGNFFENNAEKPGGHQDTEAIPLLIGSELAVSLGADVADQVALFASAGSSMAEMPRILKGVVRGVFESGYYEYDSSLVYIPLYSAGRLWSGREQGTLFWLGVKGKDPEKAEALALELSKTIDPSAKVSQILTWGQMNKNLFSALKLEKLMLTLVLSLIIFVASVSVTSNLIMIAAQKTKMIGSLSSMGISKTEVAKLMLAIGGMLGALGIIFGLFLTVPVDFILTKTDWVRLPAEVYMIERVPIELGWLNVLGVAFFTWVVSLAASALPAYRTSRLDPSQILRYG